MEGTVNVLSDDENYGEANKDLRTSGRREEVVQSENQIECTSPFLV